MKRLILALPLVIGACATQPVATPGVPPAPVITPSLTADAAECGIALALAGVTNGPSSITSAALANAACLRLPADILRQIEGSATVQANRTLRTMRRIDAR